ncbi:TetR/AcrR family transcriptional regulator [Thermococcus sp.]|uniref:TetR/AcrR family transcriptional regulator n=1 Tax=Thermococcus sp. TaxID=35749 RepID=UPI0026144A85|nr:TetR/AcrR family transcriptional regulator [Thermococcus sp.]MCD6144396.1 TetR/AcrR family transcriptional regulator [Thermococcus sp.]
MAAEQQNVIHNTRQQIIKTARKLFSKYTYLGVSMSDIARKLHITKAALYYHFTGKAEIYKKVLDDAFNGFSLSIAEAAKEKTRSRKLCKLIKNYLDFGLKEGNLIDALVLKLSPSDPQIRKQIIQIKEQIVNLIQPIVEEAFANSKLKNKIDIEMVTLLLISTMNGLLLEYSMLKQKIDTEKISKQIITVLF